MAKQYRWRASTRFQSDTTMSYGVTPNDKDSWQTEDIGSSQSGSWTYWYRDANVDVGGYTDANSSRTNVSLTESWTTSVDDLNNLTVRITTTVNSVYRDDIRGTNQDTPGRAINIYREQGGSALLSLTDYQVAQVHTIYSGPLVLDAYSFTLSPGQSLERSSMYLHNSTIGYTSYDDIWFGVQFQNNLPAPTTYSLVYDANGGSGAPAAQSTTTAQESVAYTISSTEPSWGYYQFLGWSRTKYTDSRMESDVEYRAGDTITLSQSAPTLTLYAVWRMDYRPGASLDTNANVWKSHNRPHGACHVLKNSTWQECRTIGGEAGLMGNPPSVYHDGKMYNQKLLGNES